MPIANKPEGETSLPQINSNRSAVDSVSGSADDQTHEIASAEQALAPIDNDAHTGLGPPTSLGQYQIVAKIGQGGMGMVYRALHTRLKKQVAIKVLPRECTANPWSVARFQREMEAIGRLDHDNIVRATDAGEAGGVHFLVMELIDGIDLSRLVRRHGPLSVALACDLVWQAANGLECAHEHGLVHRDVKPSNLLLSVTGQLKVLDLGLALLSQTGPTSPELTGSGQRMGTADYMAPEQWEASHAVDIRADIYSLGCTLYALLVGKPPFSGPGYDSALRKMAAHAQEPVTPVSSWREDIPAPVEDLLLRMMAKDPGERPATPAEVAQALEPFCQGADPAALVQQVLARDLPEAEKNRDEQIPEGNAVTTRRASTAGKSNRTPLRRQGSRGKLRRVLTLAVLLTLAIAILALFFHFRPQDPGVARVPVEPNQERPAFKPGYEYDLLEQPPTQVIWPANPSGSQWQHLAEKKLLSALCAGQGMLELGKAPAGRYDLEIVMSQNSWTGASGIFYRGRQEGGEGAPSLTADILLLRKSNDKNESTLLKYALLQTVPLKQKATLSFSLRDVLPRPLPGNNRLRITVGSKGLEKVHWNDLPAAPGVCIPPPSGPRREGADGSFGVYFEDSSVIINAARLIVHSISGENP